MLPLKNLTLTVDDFDNCNWQNLIEISEQKDCYSYQKVFFNKAEETKAKGDEKTQEVYTLLGAICSLRLNPDSKEVFEPAFVFESFRSYVLSDVSDLHLSALAEIAEKILDPEMRARVIDLLWVRQKGKHYSLLELGVKSYLASADTLLNTTEHWSLGIDRIERAFQLAYPIRKKDLVVTVIETLLAQIDICVSSVFPLSLMRLLLDNDAGDPAKYAEIAASLAKSTEAQNDWLAAGFYWEMKANWHAKEKNVEKQKEAQIFAAESHVKVAELYANSSQPNYAAASFEIQRAIEAFRRIGGMQERTAVLRGLHQSYQEKSLETFTNVSFEVDVTEIAQNSRGSVKDKTFSEALKILAFSAKPQDIDQLRTQVEEYIEKFPFRSWFSTVALDDKGRQFASSPSLSSDASERQEKAIRDQMYAEATRHQELIAQAIVLPIRLQIFLEHGIRLDNLFPLVVNNPFVPPGRELLYARAFYAGLTGDFLVAGHILIPQVENSIRYLLQQNGVVVSSLDTTTGLEEYHSLDALLNKIELKSILDENIIFDLRGLLVERFGTNLRNSFAHGLIHTGGFQSLRIIYFWWLILHLCYYGYLLNHRIESPSSE